MRHDTGVGLIEGVAEPLALRGGVDERNGLMTQVLVHEV